MTTQHARRISSLVMLVAMALFGSLLSGPAYSANLSPTQMASDIANGSKTASELTACSQSTDCTDALFGTRAASDSVGISQTLASANSELGSEAYVATSADCPSGSTSYFTSRYWTQKGTLGNVNYRWHWGVWYCRNNNKNTITKWIRKASWVTDAAWYVDLKEVVVTNTSGLPTSTATAYREQHVQLDLVSSFVPINFYPWGRFHLHGDGSPAGVEGSSR